MRVSVICLIFCLSAFVANSCTPHISNQDTVLAPWTPLEVTQKGADITIKCWRRKYSFSQHILPSQISSQGIDLLNEPISINVHHNGSVLEFSESSIDIVSSSKAKVELAGTAVSNSQYGEIRINSKILIEYDGLALISLQTVYPDNWVADSLNIAIAYKASIPEYFLRWMRSSEDKYSGKIPNNSGLVMQTSYVPYYWIGDDEKGLFWFCESTKSWPNGRSKSAIQTLKNNKGLVYKLNIGSYLNNYEFGLQATPVKPFPENWRKWRLATSYYKDLDAANIVLLWPSPGRSNSVKFYGWPKAVNDSIYSERIKHFQAQKKKVIAYSTITRMPSESPFYKNNRSKWIKSRIIKNQRNNHPVYIEPSSEGYADSLVKEFASYMRQYKLDGYYLDGTKLRALWRMENNEPYFPILSYRKLHRELYKAVKAIDKNALIIAHMSANMNIPVLAYTDAYVDGEQFRYRDNEGQLAYKLSDSYLDVLSLDQFRAEFLGRQWGIVPIFLPEIKPTDRDNIQPTKGIATLLLLHDVLPWLSASNPEVWSEVFKQLDTFGIEGSKFIYYFDPTPPAISSLDNVKISAFNKGNGESLIVVANLSREKQSGEVTINPARLGLSRINSVYSMANKEELAHDDGQLTLTLDGLDYDLLWIK